MSTLQVAPVETRSDDPKKQIVNDFSIQVATVNGSGSQTANSVLMRSIFQMGIPVSGKNMFPSNIAGLPTWFTIRASKQGFIARKKEIDFLIAMNPETAREDVMKLDSGAAVVYDQPLKLNELRSDLHFYPVPFDKLVGPVCPEAKLRKLVRNMIYDGILARLLDIDMEEMRKALFKQFGKRKAKAAELNMGALAAGFDYADKNLPKTDPFRVEKMNATAGKIIIEGNAAAALGSLFAGVTVVTWYPITPSSSLVESLIGYLKRFRIDKETGKATYAVVQAEDELASIGMALGAGWAGAPSTTSICSTRWTSASPAPFSSSCCSGSACARQHLWSGRASGRISRRSLSGSASAWSPSWRPRASTPRATTSISSTSPASRSRCV